MQINPEICADNSTKIFDRAIIKGVYPHDINLVPVNYLHQIYDKYDLNVYRRISLFKCLTEAY